MPANRAVTVLRIVRGAARRERPSPARAQLEDPLRPREVAQLVRAEVHELGAGREPVVHELPRGLREQRRAAVRESAQRGPLC